MGQSDRRQSEVRLRLHTPLREELAHRQKWLLDPTMMAYNAGWNIPDPRYDNATGCIAEAESEWDDFLHGYSDPTRAGYFYLQDDSTGHFVGHVHYHLDDANHADIGLNIIPSHRGEGLAAQAMGLLLHRIWDATSATAAINEFENDRTASVRLHTSAGFAPGPLHTLGTRTVRQWQLDRPR